MRAALSRILVSLFFCLLSLSTGWSAEPVGAPVGSIVLAVHQPTIEHAGQKDRRGEVGAAVFADDLLITGRKDRLVINFQDHARLHVGPSTRIKLTRYVYDAKGNTVVALMDLLRGQIRYWTEKNLGSESVEFRTKNAVAGVRGTNLEMVYWRWLEFSMVGVLEGEAVIKNLNQPAAAGTRVGKGNCGWVIKQKNARDAVPLDQAPSFFRLLGDGTTDTGKFYDPWASENTIKPFKDDY